MDSKKCRLCAESIKKDAKTCKHCKSDIRPWHQRHPILTILGTIFMWLIIAASLGLEKTGKTLIPSQENTPQLEVLSMNTYTEYSYHYITGEVKNIGDEALENVMSVGIFYDIDGNMIKSEDTLIEYTPLLPGQSSPYRVMGSYHPSITTGSISFTTLWGNPITSIDSRQEVSQ